MDTITQRVRDNRALNGPVVRYFERAGHAWLIGTDPQDPSTTVADSQGIGDPDWKWPNGGDDDKLTNVINLIEAATIAGVGPIGIDAEVVQTAGYERTCDSSGILSGARMLVTLKSGLTLAGDAVWASDLVDDEFDMHGALNALRNAAWEIHYLVEHHRTGVAP